MWMLIRWLSKLSDIFIKDNKYFKKAFSRKYDCQPLAPRPEPSDGQPSSGDLFSTDATALWSEPPSALPWTTAVASYSIYLFLPLILCSLCFTQQSVWWFKIYVSFHGSLQFKPHVTSDLSQNQNPTNGLRGPPWSALPLWPVHPWLDLFHFSCLLQMLGPLCCFSVPPSLFSLSEGFFYRCLCGSFSSRIPFGRLLTCHSRRDRSLSATPPPLPAALPLPFPWFVFLCYSYHCIS